LFWFGLVCFPKSQIRCYAEIHKSTQLHTRLSIRQPFNRWTKNDDSKSDDEEAISIIDTPKRTKNDDSKSDDEEAISIIDTPKRTKNDDSKSDDKEKISTIDS